MAYAIVNRLHESLEELERSVRFARQAVTAQNPVPLELLRKINEFEKVLDTQRKLAACTSHYLSSGQFEEVNRALRLTAGMMARLQDGTREVLSQAVGA
jgi:hypothetical protein